MTNFWQTLNKPFTVLAPMDDVTDVVFREIVRKAARPTVFFTEFTNCDGLMSAGRAKLMPRLDFKPEERPIVAQIWGTNPETYFQTAQLCQFLSAQVPNVAWSLAVSARGIISLRADSGTEVVLGSFDRWPKKVEKLKSLLAERPDLLQSVRQLNLMSPEAPVFVRG